MATVPNLTAQDVIAAADANIIRGQLANLLNTGTDTAYGATPRNTEASAVIQVATADYWQRLYDDVNSCYRHRTGNNISTVARPTTDSLITTADINALYNIAVACVNDRYTVAPNQLETTSVTEEFTNVTPWSEMASYAFSWTWGSALEANWHFNLGGSHSFSLSSSGATNATDLILSQAVASAASIISQKYTRAHWVAGAEVEYTTVVSGIEFTVTYTKESDSTLRGQILIFAPGDLWFNNVLTGSFNLTRSIDAIPATLPVTDELTRILVAAGGPFTATLAAGQASALRSVSISNASDFETLTISNISATAAGATGYVVSSATDFSSGSQLVPLTYPIVLAPTASTTVKFFYTRPVSSSEGLGAFDNALIITSDSDLGTTTIPVTVTVAAPDFDFSLDLVDYDQMYTYVNWESNDTRRNLGIAIANRFYLPNTDFGLISGTRRYGLYRKPDYVGLDYWTTVCATSYSSNPTSTAFTELFFNSLNPASDDFGRSFSNAKSFDAGWGYGDFYDRSLVDVDVASGSNKYYKYFIRPEYGTVKSYTSGLSDFKFNNSSVSGTSSAAKSFAVDNNMGSALPPAVTQSPITTAMANSSPIDGPRVRFDPFDVLSVGAYTATLTVTVTAVDLAGSTVTVARTATVNINVTTVTNGNLANWRSAVGYNNAIMGISYDRIDGTGYLTVGVGAGGDGSPVAAPTGYAYVDVANLGASADSKYRSGQPLYKSISNTKWSSFMNMYGVWPVNPVPTSTAPAADFTVCISVIDESDEYSAEDFYNLWAAFRSKYPTRPFYLLCPGNYANLNVPSNFLADSNAHVMNVSRSGSNVGLRDDWYALCNLGSAIAGTRVLLSVDDSGSMVTSTVQASYDYFKSRIASSTLVLSQVNMGNSENWIAPHDSYYVSYTPQSPSVFNFDLYYDFNVPADADYLVEFQSAAGGYLRIDGVNALSATGVSSAATSKTMYLTAGTHRVGFVIPDSRNDIYGTPLGVAVRISRITSGSNIWTTLEPVRASAPYLNWGEVYRMPITYRAPAVLRSRDYVIKHGYLMSNVNGSRLTDFFGTPGTDSQGSLLTVNHDGYGNLSFDWAMPENFTNSEFHNTTLNSIVDLPYYYSFSSNRMLTSNLENLLPNQQTHRIIGMTPVSETTSVVNAPGLTSERSFGSPGVYRFTVPSFASRLMIDMSGAGGGGGGADRRDGGNGRPGTRVTGVFSVTPNSILEIFVGAGGNGGANGQNVAGGSGGWGFLESHGGNGGVASSGGGTSGSGGGGGGASGIRFVNTGEVIAVAGGGGGGGGGGKNTVGLDYPAPQQLAGPTTSNINGAAGGNHPGDGGSGGGGGSGYPTGGKGGDVPLGDNGGSSGTDGGTYSINASVSAVGVAGGLGQSKNQRPSSKGNDGYVKISFSI